MHVLAEWNNFTLEVHSPFFLQRHYLLSFRCPQSIFLNSTWHRQSVNMAFFKKIYLNTLHISRYETNVLFMYIVYFMGRNPDARRFLSTDSNTDLKVNCSEPT